MSFEPNAQQTLLLWRMLVAATPEEREPMKSKAKPDIGAKHRNALIEHGFLEAERRKGQRGEFLVLTNKAWEWASRGSSISIMKSQVASNALQDLLRRLIPYLHEHDIPLAEVLADAPNSDEANASQGAEPSDALCSNIEQACLELANGVHKSRVRLSALRRALSDVPRAQVDTALVALQRQGRLVLYRDDNSAALTTEDHEAALQVGDSPRHLVYLEA